MIPRFVEQPSPHQVMETATWATETTSIDDQLHAWEGMIHYVIRHLRIHPNERDDCAQIARIALWKALEKGQTLSKTYCFIRIRGAILNYRNRQARHLRHEVASDELPEVSMEPEMSLVNWLQEKEGELSERQFELLCHLIDGSEETLAYSASRLRAYKAELYHRLRAL